MIVKKQFYCTREKKTYYKGDFYTGKRKDISHLFEDEIEIIAEVVKPKKKRK
jgi:hypothetical protein